jgi:Transposase
VVAAAPGMAARPALPSRKAVRRSVRNARQAAGSPALTSMLARSIPRKFTMEFRRRLKDLERCEVPTAGQRILHQRRYSRATRSVSIVARRHDVNRNQLFRWRRWKARR